MDAKRHNRVLEIFSAAFELRASERQRVLERECAGDRDLRAEVAAHLARYDAQSSFLEPPALGDGFLLEPAALGDSPDSRLSGQQIGKYHLQRILGSGGMGSVYEALQRSPRRTVAVKVMRPGLASSRALRRFEHEAQILARLRHPGIAQIYETGALESGPRGEVEMPWFAMEYVPEARSITRYASEEGLGIVERIELFARVCDAVHYGHQRGIIHRDLKPDNILVDGDGDPKVIDFGVARATDADVQLSSLGTDVGQLVGTLQYMSPEQCGVDPHELDTRSDVYSLGLVLYELLCGALPYDLSRLAIHQAVAVIRETAPPRPGTTDHRLRGDLDTIAAKALEKERERRYGSAAELGQDLRRFLRHEPIMARPPSAAYQLRMFARRNRALVGGIAAVFVALVLGLLGTTWQAQEAEAARVEETHQREEAEREAATKTAIYEFMHETLTGFEPGEKDMSVREMIDRAARRIEGSFAAQPRVEAEVRGMIQWTYRRMGSPELAEPHARRAAELLEEALGPDDEWTVRAWHELGRVLQDLGRAAEAEPMARRLLEWRRAHLGEEHGETLDALNDLAMNYWAQGRLDEAEPLMRQVVDARTNAADLGNLGCILQGQGKLDEAITCYRTALEEQRFSGADELDVPASLTSLMNLGKALTEAGNLDGAFRAFGEALAGRRERLGDDHPATLDAIRELAWLSKRRGDFETAMTHYAELLAAQHGRFGERSVEAACTLHHWAACAQALGELEMAEGLAREALEVYHALPSAPPDEHRHATEALYEVLLHTGAPEDRIAALREALAFQRRNVHPGHLELNAALRFLGAELLAQGEAAEAEGLLREALAAVEPHWTPGSENHWRVMDLKSQVGDALLQQGRLVEAEPLLLEGYERLDASRLASGEKARAGDRILKLYEAWQRPDEVAAWRARLAADSASRGH